MSKRVKVVHRGEDGYAIAGLTSSLREVGSRRTRCGSPISRLTQGSDDERSRARVSTDVPPAPLLIGDEQYKNLWELVNKRIFPSHKFITSFDLSERNHHEVIRIVDSVFGVCNILTERDRDRYSNTLFDVVEDGVSKMREIVQLKVLDFFLDENAGGKTM